MKNLNHFRSERTNSFRNGEIRINGKCLDTPHFFPVVNLITGPPGLNRNGGIWKHIKIEFFQNERIPAFLSQIMHFLDFNIPKKTLEKWYYNKGNPYKFQDWIKELVPNSYSPIIFIDSGGFKLQYNSSIDTSMYGFELHQKSIYNLQSKFGADIIASLDFPVHPNIPRKEYRFRTTKSIDNAISCLELVYDHSRQGSEFPFLAVHGHSYSDVYSYVSDLINKIDENGYINYKFGFAIGSLVPLRNHYELLVEIVLGVKDAINDSESIDVNDIPIHVFGISSYIIPFLSYLGVDTFDSNTYAQAAINLTYLSNDDNWKLSKFLTLNELDCKCNQCNYLNNGGIKEAQKIIRDKPYQKYLFNGETIDKSKIYSLIATHNYHSIKSLVSTTYSLNSLDKKLEYLLSYSETSNKGKLLLSRLATFDKNIKGILEEYKIKIKPYKKVSYKNKFSLQYKPHHFNILQRDYKAKENKYMLMLPCSNKKPYHLSKSHRYIYSNLVKSGINIDLVSKVTISGNYGPVPYEFENIPAVRNYNYFLSHKNSNQCNVVLKRTVKFIKLYEGHYDKIIGYATAKTYRDIFEKLSVTSDKIHIFPQKLKQKKGNEFYRKSNLDELINFIIDDSVKT